MDPVVQRIIEDVERRLEQFESSVARPVEENPELLDPAVRWWHERRQADAEANAALYGIEAPDVGPRMTRAKIWSGTLSRDGITGRHWAIPDHAKHVMDVRDLSRRLLVSPFTIWEWTRQGMPTLRYYPWRRYDLNLVQRWLVEQRVDVPQEVTLQEVDNITRFVLKAVRDGRGSVEDAEEILESM